ncbi:MAG: ATP-dependent DNA helicase RecG [Eubacterium sp.]|nr:ATP-dependent DNA helicase RecG [Eubacterium sp.]
MRLEEDIIKIKGIGDKTRTGFNKLGIYSVRDLVRYYPRTYKTYSDPVSVRDASEGDRVAVKCKIVTYVEVHKGKRYTITGLSASDGTGTIRMVWFNMPFLRNAFHKGESFVFFGVIKLKGNMRVMEMPEYFTPFQYEKALKTMQPIYSLKAGITNNSLSKAVKTVLPVISSLSDYLPDEVVQKYQLMPLGEAIKEIHFPENEEKLKNALKRIAFDEFLEFLIKIRKLKEETIVIANDFVISETSVQKCKDFISSLPYSLTNGQRQTVDDIFNDMKSDHVMNRLIQGDVGSGKTVVAEIALLAAVKSGYQGALMVPTEVLAVQHFEDMQKRFEGMEINICLLTGSVSVKDKRKIYEDIKSGRCDIVVGTHAIIQEGVQFKSLGLVITDEQHRFGVKQREKLSGKGESPHTIVMSATPIPRTLAIILYADMDISVIKELPAERKRIKNCVVGTDYRPSAYKFISQQVGIGHQAYVICPMVEENDITDAEDVISYTEELKENLGEGIRVSYLHGKMKENEKTNILHRFMNREIDVLVSTTVIEVGINNSNATVIMIENAERFGLAQLHQLRGRVGRGEAQSYAIFINVKKSEDSVRRLKCLEESNDGFFIASEDLRLRGPGDFFGIRQSGEMDFHVADIFKHADMLRLAQDISLQYGDKLDVVVL